MYLFKGLSSTNSAPLILRSVPPFEGIYSYFTRYSLDITNSSLILVILAGPLMITYIT